MKSLPKPRAKSASPKSQKPAADTPDPFPAGMFVEIVVGKRQPRLGQIAQRVDATHWRVDLASGGSALITEKQLRKVDPPEAWTPAAKPEKPARKPQAPRGRHAELLAAAEKGAQPPPPDFTAETHKPYRKRLAALVALVEAGDLAGLEAAELPPPRSTSPKALHRYRDLAATALKAQAATKADLDAAREALLTVPSVQIGEVVLRDYQAERADEPAPADQPQPE
jgi:hypothetical protein